MVSQVEFNSCIEAICNICGSIPGARQFGERWSKKWHIPADKIDQLEAKLKDVSEANMLQRQSSRQILSVMNLVLPA